MSSKIMSALLFTLILVSTAAPMILSTAGIAGSLAGPGTTDFAKALPPNASRADTEVFTPNIGQVGNAEVLFFTPNGMAAFTRDSVLLYSDGREGADAPQYNRDGAAGRNIPESSRQLVLRMSFPGSNPVEPVGLDSAQWRSNFLLGNDPSKWKTGVANYRALMYEDLWDGIDLVYRIEGGALKYEFLVEANADHRDIRVMAEGQEGMSVRAGTALEIDLGGGRTATDSGLDVFYSDNRGEKMAASFVLLGEGIYTFSISGRDDGRALTIDPLMYSTFFGGGGFDRAADVAVGSDGCTYLTGCTDSLNFPTTIGALDREWAGWAYDAFVTKMSQNGATVAYSTYIGGDASDCGQAITVDDKGYAYFAGYTMSYFYPVTPGAFQPDYGGATYDAFVTKLSPMGDSLVYSSFLGGDGFDFASGIAVDVNGFAYVVGDTRSFDFPVTPNALLTAFHGTMYGDERDNIFQPDVFVTKVSQLGTSLSYSTYIGGNGSDIGYDIAVDGNGYAYVTGLTWSNDFVLSSDPYDQTYNGMCDVFVTKLTQTGSRTMYSTYIGGPGIDVGASIAVGPWGNAYVAGYTMSTHFPTTPGVYDETHNGMTDVFAMTLSKNGDSLGYSTLIGGARNDYCTDLALDSWGCVYLAGYTDSADLPTTENAFDRTYNGGNDALVSKVSPSGHLLHSTYLGGNASDCAWGLALGADDFTYVAGDTSSSDFPTTGGVLGQSYIGNTDAFVTKLDIAPPLCDAGPAQAVPEGTVVELDARNSTDNHGIVNYTWQIYDGLENETMHVPMPRHLFAVPGQYLAWLNVTDISGNWDVDAVNLTILDITHPIAVAGPDIVADEDTVVAFNASASSDNVGVANYTWTFAENGVARHLYGPTPTYVFYSPGVYAVTLEVTDAAGNNATDTLRADIIDVTRPDAEAGKDRKVYQYTVFTFNGTGSKDNVQIVNYTWRLNDGVSDLALYSAMSAHQFTVTGIFPVTLTVTDAAGLWDTDMMTLTVLEIVKPVADAGQDITANEAVPVRFDGTGCTDNVGVAQWAWSFNDGVNRVRILGESPSWIFAVPGTYEVTLNASDAAGNWDTDSLTVTILDCLPPTAEAGPNRVVPAGTEVALDGSGSFDSSGITSYEWSFAHNGSAVTLDGPVQSFRFWTPGTYNVTLTVTDAAGSTASSMMQVTVIETGAGEMAIWTDEYGWILVCAAGALFIAAGAVLFRQRRGSTEP